jgi:hypothetical protein
MNAEARVQSRPLDVGAIFAIAGVTTERIGPQTWSLVAPGNTRLIAHVDACDGWLVLEASLERNHANGDRTADWWTWLLRGRGLATPVKLVLVPGAARPVLRADIPLGEDADIAATAARACAAVASAAQAIGASASSVAEHDRAEASARVSAVTASASVDFATMCAEAGWQCVGGSDTAPRVNLQLSGRQVLALLEHDADGGLRASVELLRRHRATLTQASQEALALFLLTSSAIVRLARADVEEVDDSVAMGFEVRCAAPCGVEDVGHALSSLSVACGMCDREVLALADDRIARLYLTLRHQGNGGGECSTR